MRYIFCWFGLPFVFMISVKDYILRDKLWCMENNIGLWKIFTNNWELFCS